MDKTIEERADEYVKDCCPRDWEFVRPARSGYIKGATEQKAIDIDTACDWLRNHLWAGDDVITAFTKEMINKTE